ncbi:MAG TPA: nucleotidyltransferase family protein [Armatimonadota bacterium]|nr:nucleotidyltransferase family protein [Armatimonadota bacterium]
MQSSTGRKRVHPLSPRAVDIQQVRRLLRRRLPDLRERYGVRSLGIFGSCVRGKRSRRSDLDILVEFDRPPTLLQFVRIERELSEQLGAKVDLVMRSALKPAIGARILAEVVPV